jgi:hypothetical protein
VKELSVRSISLSVTVMANSMLSKKYNHINQYQINIGENDELNRKGEAKCT